ncbi:MAG: DUF1501 domain-containing protein [Bryobacterales bacterium]|nr:DUF1501 domain-containing protein [Bryobacterales bacterium]
MTLRRGCLSGTREDFGRRDFIKVGALGFLGINLSQSLQLEAAMAATGTKPEGKAKSCILVFLEGGPSQIDTWDPKPNSSFRPISTNVAGIQVSELLPSLAKRMDKLALIRSIRSFGDDHPQAMHYAATGHLHIPAMQFPSFGAIVAKELGPQKGMPPYVIVPRWERNRQYQDYFKSAFLGPDFDPLTIPDPSAKNFQVDDLTLPKSVAPAAVENRRAFLDVIDGYYRDSVKNAEHAKMDSFRQKALEMILTPGVREAFDLSKESDKIRDSYGRDTVGQSLLLARRLVEGGTRFVTAAGFHGNSWDTHSDNDRTHRDRLTPLLDRSVSALIDDLVARGLYDSTIVIVMGEFGRTPHVNPNLGRDHWPICWSIALGGGGIKTGTVVGKSDERGAYCVERQVSLGDIFATVYKAMGIQWDKEYITPVGRPIKIANSIKDATGEPITELV